MTNTNYSKIGGDFLRFIAIILVINSDVAKKFDLRLRLGIPDNAVIVGFIGRLVHIKGVDVLLQAISLLAEEQPHLYCVVVGDGAERARLEVMAHQLGIAGRVQFTGAVSRENAYSTIKAFDIVAMPSREGLEGFGLSALEAMACGVPVVASRVDALKEVVLDGTTGLMFVPGKPEDLAAKLAALLQNGELRQRLAEAAVERVRKEYNWVVYRENINEVLA